MTTILLTVLTPTLDCVATLPDTLRSVEALHSCLPGRVQHLIGDAGSNDGTSALLEAYAGRNPWARLHRLPGRNIPATLNLLLAEADGQWVMVLNGDDFFEVGRLADLVAQRGAGEPPRIVCGDVEVRSAEGNPLGFRYCRLDRLHRFMAVNHAAMLVPRRVFDRTGGFDPRYPMNYDYVWTWRAYRAGVRFVYQPGVLAQVRLGGISTRHSHRAAREILAAKIAAGCVLPALRDYGAHRVKAGLRAVLPRPASRWLTTRYRRFKKSLDRY